nr:MATE family efflux transporter [uncultured Dysosmobacter sp.]
MSAKAMDLTTGSIPATLFRFAFPILLSQVLQNLYNSADAVVVGRFCDTTALAAVSACSDMSRLLTGFFTGLSTGSGIMIARYYGAKDLSQLRKVIHTSLLFSILLGIFMAAAGILCAPWLLRITRCRADIFPQALHYLRIYLFGILFTSMYNVAASISRAVGDSRTPLLCLVASCITNILVDFIAVAWLGLGVIGAGLATVFSQLLSVTMVFFALFRTKDVHRISLQELHIHPQLLKEVIDLGLPAALQNSLTAISALFVQGYVNSFETYAIAGVGAARKIDKFAGLVALSIGNATTMYVSQNLGADKPRQAIRGMYVALAMTIGISVCISAPSFFFAPSLVGIFSEDPQTIAIGAAMVRTMMPLYFLQAFCTIHAHAIRGFRYSRTIMAINLFSFILVRQVFLAVAMNISHDIRFIYLCEPIGWAVASVLDILFFHFYVKPHQLSAEEASAQ